MKQSTVFAMTKVVEEMGIKELVVGIDLGTTNSGLATVRAGNSPSMIKLGEGLRKTTMPSCIMWKGKDDEFIVGTEAYNNRYKKSAVYSIKRLMGSRENVTVSYGKRTKVMTPAEVSSVIIKGLLAEADPNYKNIKKAVITVPAHFNNLQIDDTIKAGELAGLEVLSVLREPTAAAIAYGIEFKIEQNKVVIVYDLGGGTFDASAVRAYVQEESDSLGSLYSLGEEEDKKDESPGIIYSVLTTDGDTKLGGDDIDLVMYKLFETKLIESGFDITKFNKEEIEQFILHMEKLKKNGIGEYSVPVHGKDKSGAKLKSMVQIGESDFMSAAKTVYLKTKKILDRVIDSVGIENVSEIILVGGSTKSEAIRKFLRRDYPMININTSLNPDEAVALGAGIKSKRDVYGDSGVTIFDVLPISIGVEGSGFMDPVIRKDTRVPCNNSIYFTTERDNQKVARVKILQGNSRYVEQCQLLGEIVVDNIPAGEAGSFEGKIILNLDSNGHLTCEVDTPLGKLKKELINVFGSKKETGPEGEVDRRLVQWRKFAAKLSGEDANFLNDVLDKYEQGILTAANVSNSIRELQAIKPAEKSVTVIDNNMAAEDEFFDE